MDEWGLDESMVVKITFMFNIIIGRWILPKGDISHSALSQLLLVYLSLASDILDLSTLFYEKEIEISSPMVRLVLAAFSLCMLQFALNLTATRGRSFRAEFDQTEIEIHQSAPPQSITEIVQKPIPRHRQILSKFLSRSASASSTARPLGARIKRPKPRSATVSTNLNLPDTIFENPDAIRKNELQLSPSRLRMKNIFFNSKILFRFFFVLVDSPMSMNRKSFNPRPSITSINSTQSSVWNPSSRDKPRPRKKSISGSVRFFVRDRSLKFLRSEIWSILVTLLLQDGPFFAVRVVAITVYRAGSYLTYFFTIKNFLILVFQTYRIAAICFEKDEQEHDFQEKVNTMKRMSSAATQLGIPLHRKI